MKHKAAEIIKRQHKGRVHCEYIAAGPAVLQHVAADEQTDPWVGCTGLECEGNSPHTINTRLRSMGGAMQMQHRAATAPHPVFGLGGRGAGYKQQHRTKTDRGVADACGYCGPKQGQGRLLRAHELADRTCSGYKSEYRTHTATQGQAE